MKLIIIDDNKAYSEALSLHFMESNLESEIHSTIGGDLRAWTENLIENSKNTGEGENINDTDVFFINVNLKTDGDSRLQQRGLELLIWLRIKNVMNHCVLYSFETLHTLLNRKPKHVIATSKGTSYVQLPSDFSQIANILEKKRTKNALLAEKENLKAVLKPAFSIEKMRHQAANWWGMKLLWDAHRLHHRSFNPYPEQVQNHLKSLNNALAVFLYESDSETLNKVAEEIEKNKREEREQWEADRMNREQMENSSISKIRDELNDTKELIEDIKKFKGVLNDKEQIKVLKAAGQLQEWKAQLQEDEKSLPQLENYKTELEASLKNEKNEKRRIRNEEFEWVIADDPFFQDQINELHFDDYNFDKKKTVLVIDDLADEGWKKAYQEVLGENIKIKRLPVHRKTDNYQTAKYKLSKQLHNFLHNFFDPINQDEELQQDILCILLDLRLFKEDSDSKPVEEFTGCVMLDEIKNEYPYIPVIITTASNKIWTYMDTQKLGADAYWNKEGIDNFFSKEESIENYNRLRELVYNFSKDEYTIMRTMGKTLRKLENDDGFWWEQRNWQYPNPKVISAQVSNKDGKTKREDVPFIELKPENKVTKDEVVRHFKKSIKIFSHYLSGRFVTKQIRDEYYEAFFAAVIVQLGRLIEILHRYKIKEQANTSYKSVMKARKDKGGQQLYNVRHKFAHQDDKVDLSENNLINVFKYYVEYLDYYLTQQNDDIETVKNDLLSMGEYFLNRNEDWKVIKPYADQ